ncbi:MAG: ATP-binding protein, partial [Phycisphaerales bacterium]|nr:ATP-binding protein [Phycisphaerales bacterium]
METRHAAAPRRHGEQRPRESLDGIRQRLSDAVGSECYERYFEHQARLEMEDGRLCVTVPSPFVRDLITRRFGASIREAAGTGEVEYHVDTDAFDARRPASRPESPRPRTRRPSFGHRLDDYVVGACNRLAYSAATQIAEAEHASNFSPLFIHGGCGLGKTHLLQGIANRFAERHPGARIRYLTAEEFTNQFVTALRSNALEAFRQSFRGVDLLCIDDVHFLERKDATQAELVHTLNALDLRDARIALASDEHPSRFSRVTEALSSRFVAGAVIRLDPPDEVTRARILHALATRRQVPITVEAAARAVSLAGRPDCSVREIEGILTQIEAAFRLLPEYQGCSSLDVIEVTRILGGTRAERPRAWRPIRVEEIVTTTCRVVGV